jgi:hypothetical protein
VCSCMRRGGPSLLYFKGGTLQRRPAFDERGREIEISFPRLT